jgi:hypothetical protein
LERDFDRLFTRRTGFVDLNEALRRIHEKRDDLLLVLERPEIPLHNNLSESNRSRSLELILEDWSDLAMKGGCRGFSRVRKSTR